MVRLASCTLEIRPLYSLLAQTRPHCCCNATLPDTAPTVHREALEAGLLTNLQVSALSEGANTQKTGYRPRKGSFGPLQFCRQESRPSHDVSHAAWTVAQFYLSVTNDQAT